MSGPRKSRLGRLGEAAILLLVSGGILFGAGHAAFAQAPDPRSQLEHRDPTEAAGPTHNQAAAHIARPEDPAFLAPFRQRLAEQVKKQNPSISKADLDKQVAVGLAPVVDITKQAMAKLVCMCGGCTRETVYECKCSIAANERQKVLAMMSRHDLLDAGQRKAAYDEVVAWYTARFGGEHALIVPEKEKAGRIGWMVPVVMVVAGLGLLYAIGRRWVVRGRRDMSERKSAVAAAEADENEDYVDRLDDELRDTD